MHRSQMSGCLGIDSKNHERFPTDSAENADEASMLPLVFFLYTFSHMLAFIVLDGPDGSGTTTHAKFLFERLQKEGHDVLLTAEPTTDGPVGKQIREQLSKGNMDPMALQMLFTTDRAWHVQEVIEPALAQDKTVVCDRYWYSTIVYAEAQGLDSASLLQLNEKFLQPTIAIFTMPPIDVSLQRVLKRASKEIFEKEDLQRKIYAGYEKIAAARPEVVSVDTSAEKAATADRIWNAVVKKL